MKINCITDAIKLLGLRVGDEFVLDGKNFSKYKLVPERRLGHD